MLGENQDSSEKTCGPTMSLDVTAQTSPEIYHERNNSMTILTEQ